MRPGPPPHDVLSITDHVRYYPLAVKTGWLTSPLAVWVRPCCKLAQSGVEPPPGLRAPGAGEAALGGGGPGSGRPGGCVLGSGSKR